MRRLLLLTGILILPAMWFGPIAKLGQQAFFVHMIVHMVVVAVAAPLMACGLAGGRFDPVRRFPAVFLPVPASMIEFLVVWAWHVPHLHHLARHSPAGLIAEQGMFLVSGLYLWLSAVGGDSLQRTNRTGAGVLGLLLTAMHMTLLGVLIALAPRPLYPHSAGFAGLSPLDDQHLGGAIMILMGGIVYVGGGLCLMARLLQTRSLKPGGPQ